MYFTYDPDEYETVFEHGPHHVSMKQVRRAPAEIAAIKERARLKREDEILAEAEAIMRRRSGT